MSIFSRVSKKRKDFVEAQMKEYNTETSKNYTEIEANDKYMKTKETKWANDIIVGFKKYCEVLCDPESVWTNYSASNTGRQVFCYYQNDILLQINTTMHSDKYKNVEQGGSSSKYLKTVQDELSKVMGRTYSQTDPVNLKSSMQTCGKNLKKLTHPLSSKALVKQGKKRNESLIMLTNLHACC